MNRGNGAHAGAGARGRSDQMRALAYQLLSLADDLDQPVGGCQCGLTDDLSAQSDVARRMSERLRFAPSAQMRAHAARHYAIRRKRDEIFGSELFGEAAWDMLLDLFVSRIDGKDIYTTSACLASAVPPTTALRYIALLEGKGLIATRECETDKRVSLISLTDSAYRLMAGMITDRVQETHGQLDLPLGRRMKLDIDIPLGA